MMLIIDIKSLYDTLQNAYMVKFKLKSSLKSKIKTISKIWKVWNLKHKLTWKQNLIACEMWP
jgi:hypothetical protein